MSSRRTLILLGAVVIGGVAALLLFNYVSGLEDKANQDAELVEVFAARSPIPQSTDAGVALDAGDIARDEIPRKFYPADAITSINDIEGKVAILDIAPGTVITKAMFVDPANASVSFRSRLQDPTHVAVSIQVDTIRGVGGFLQPGDDVNILVNVTEGGGPATNADAAAAADPNAPVCPELAFLCGDAVRPAYFVYQKVNILAVGSLAELQPGEATEDAEGTSTQTNTGLITFNVPPDAAALIASIAPENLYLTLVGKEYEPSAEWAEKTAAIYAGTLPPGEDPAQLTPYGPAGLEDED